MSLESRRKKDGPGQLPMNIGHRGFKAMFPENTMASFKGAVAVGADALETDLHLSRDGVVVISHVRDRFMARTTFSPCKSFSLGRC
jgi:glycerophosphoryl diester phosphodiesterase